MNQQKIVRRNNLSDFWLFIGQMLRRPWRVVALSPSGRRLAAAMAAGLGPNVGNVIELGAGTGAITSAILKTGLQPDHLVLVEMNATFAELLRKRFAPVAVYEMKAQSIGRLPIKDVGAVISGLPLLSMPKRVQSAIVAGAFRKMRPGGRFVQFTYGSLPPIDADVCKAQGLAFIRGARVWLNVPPARVYIFTKKAGA